MKNDREKTEASFSEKLKKDLREFLTKKANSFETEEILSQKMKEFENEKPPPKYDPKTYGIFLDIGKKGKLTVVEWGL